MIRIYHKNASAPQKLTSQDELEMHLGESLIWVDLQFPTQEETDYVEQLFQVSFQFEKLSEEIESSSRYMELSDRVIINSTFIDLSAGSFQTHSSTFVLKDKVLFTYRHASLRTFEDTVRKMKANPALYDSGPKLLVLLFETRVDLDADTIELVSTEISTVSRQLIVERNVQEEMLISITRYQEIMIQLRANIVDKQRMISALMRSDEINHDAMQRLRILIKDINSLLEHTTFNFERLEYLQNTLLGLISIDQNKIIKIFTVVSVVFMPPTLIASLYGMNFENMPELKWKLGYPYAILLMVLSSVATLYVFRRKRWL